MPKRNLAWILVIILIALLMWQLPHTIAERDSVLKQFGALVDASAEIRRRYVEPVDEVALDGAAVDAAMRAMIDTLKDPHARYLDKNEYRQFKERTDGRYGGIGVEVWARDEGLEILSRAPNSPATRAGLMPGDIITEIDDVSTAGMLLVEAASLLHGSPDTEIKLTIVRPADEEPTPRSMRLFRTEIDLDPVCGWSRSAFGGWRHVLDERRGIAYVRLIKFAPNVDERLDEVISQLQRHALQGLVLDLRDNTGGLLDSAREVADRFLDDGLLVRVGGRRSDEKRWFAKREGTYPKIPVVVLVNAETASAAEIVAGALRDHQRALLVGERTYGKGSVQEVVELDRDAGAIKLTTAYYYLPGGTCIHKTPRAEKENKWGVEPDVEVSLSKEEHQRWVSSRREISREPMAPEQADTPIESAGSFEEQDRREAARRLIAADPQLKKALEYLQERLKPVEPPPSEKRTEPPTIS